MGQHKKRSELRKQLGNNQPTQERSQSGAPDTTQTGAQNGGGTNRTEDRDFNQDGSRRGKGNNERGR